jgi:hypothetical protein
LSRADREKIELQKWIAVLSRKLIDARTPVFLQAETAADPMAALSRAVGNIRVSTLKTYLKRWQPFEVWCRRSYGLPWPTEVGQVLDYIEVLAEDVKPSVPQQTLQALQWMEKTAGWTGEFRLIHSPLVIRAFENLVVEAGAGLQAKKQAPRFPFVALASLELFVKRAGLPVMRRIQGKSLLLRSYGTCRFDDLQNINPDKLRKVGGLVVTELLRSKTTGAGKRNRELPIAVSLEASLLGTDWLLSLLEDLDEVKEGPRDFLLQSASYDGQRPRPVEKAYAESAAETKWILEQLKIPILVDDVWIESESPVFPLVCIPGFSEHSGRPVMPSAAVAVEPEKSNRDMLGKWMIGGGSVDYTRTFRNVVARMQKDIVKAVCTGRMAKDLREDDVADRLVRFLVENRGWDRRLAEEMLARQLLAWSEFYSCLCKWHVVKKTFEPDEWQHALSRNETLTHAEIADAGTSFNLPSALPVPNQTIVAPRRKLITDSRFLIAFNKQRTIARLHKAKGGCPASRHELSSFSLHDHVISVQYNKRCKHCWPKGPDSSEDSDTESPAD